MAPRKTTTKKTTTKRTATSASKPNKPVVRTGTWITVILLVLAIAGAYLINRNAESTAQAEITPTVEPQYLFDATNIVKNIEVTRLNGEPVRLERKDNTWVLTKPFETEADAGLAEAAASQISALQINQEITGNPSDYGFDEPLAIITIEFENGNKNTLEVGDANPIGTGYFVRLDNENIFLVSLSGIDSLLTLADFPPYLNTPTPTSTPLPATETLVPTIEASPTP
jgi:hypothetical protein